MGLGWRTNRAWARAILSAVAGGAALLCPPAVAPAQSPPAPPPPPRAATSPVAATTPTSTPAAPTITDPAVVLRAGNVPQAERDEAARRLILRQTPESRQIIAAALTDATNRRAQVAAARAILVDPEPDQEFINPLFDLIGPDAAATDAAIQALASYRAQPDVAQNLLRIAVDPQRQQREGTRISAIRAIGTMPNKPTARALMELLTGDGESPAVRGAAAAALSDMTGASVVRTDPAHWERWWAANEEKPDAEFERDLLEARGARLVRLQNRFDRFVGEARVMLEELYQRAPEKDKESILLRYLRSTEPETRTLGAKIVSDDFKQTRPITPAVRDQLRGMVADSSSNVRIAVAQALFILNDAQASDVLLAQLAREPDADVRMELARALVPMRDARVVEPLLRLLRDPSLAVAEVAARGLGDPNLTPLIQRDPALATRVAQELTQALARRADGPGTASLRASLVDAMGALRNPNLHNQYVQLLNPRANEPIAVRRAALRALGQLGKPNGETWPANAIAEALRDGDETVRQEAVRALKTTADFGHAESLYALIRRDTRETSQNVRDEAWGVLRNLFSDASATNSQLMQFADRFKDDPEKRIEVAKVLADRLTPLNDPQSQSNLASVRSILGAEYMELARRAADRADLDPVAREQAVIENAKQADIYFDLALKHYRAKDPTDQMMTTSDLLERRMDALLASKQYQTATDFAAASIAANSGNQEAMGRKINAEADRLRNLGRLDDALRLIESAKTMNPPLAAQIAPQLQRIEADVRARMQANQANPSGPRSAVGSGQ